MAEHVLFWPPPDCADIEDGWGQFIDATVETSNGLRTATEIWLDFRDSKFGQHFEHQPRRYMTHFGYDWLQMEKDLGPDVNPNGHQVATATYIAWALMAELRAGKPLPIPKSSIGILRLIGLKHDEGELTHPEIKAEVGAVVGDIPAGQKTDEQRAIEAKVRQAINRRYLREVPAKIISIMESVITHQDDSPLHDIYELSHHILTSDTARRALRVALRRAEGKLPRNHAEAYLLQSLHDIVLPGEIQKISNFAGRYAIADQYLAGL